jgi:competence protein ComFC
VPGKYDYMEARRLYSGLFSSGGFLSRLVGSGLDLVFPPSCAGCGLVDAVWCDRCDRALAAFPIHLYSRSIEGMIEVASSGPHTGILQQADHALKYYNAGILRKPLGARLALVLEMLGWVVDVVVPVPIHDNRLRLRGYNQAALLAEEVALAADVAYMPGGLRRNRDTRSQVGLNQRDRALNVAGAFTGDEQVLAGHCVLLVDDVCTSGGTLAECADAARKAGADGVYGLTVTMAGQ